MQFPTYQLRKLLASLGLAQSHEGRMSTPLQPIDLCVHVPRQGRWVAKPWTVVIGQSRFAEIKEVANDIYYAVGCALCVCPIVEELGSRGLQLTWEHDNRTLVVKLVPGEPVRYQRTVTASIEDPGWHTFFPDDSANTTLTFFRHGRYLSGKKPEECLGRKQCRGESS